MSLIRLVSLIQAHDKGFVEGIETLVKLNGSYADLTAQLTQLKNRSRTESGVLEEKNMEEVHQFSLLKLQKFQKERATGKPFLRMKRIRPVSLKTGLTVVAAILGVMALKAIYFRSACKEWPLEVAKEKQNLQNATRTISLRQEEYNARAKLNCDWYFRNIKRKEVYSFCKTGYPMTHIPLVWHLPSEHSPDKVCLFPPGPLLDIPEVRLTCHAHEVLKARLHANEIQSRLEFIKARPPSFCVLYV